MKPIKNRLEAHILRFLFALDFADGISVHHEANSKHYLILKAWRHDVVGGRLIGQCTIQL